VESLTSANLAENAGRASVSALAVLGFTAGCARLHGVARGYFRRMHEAPIAPHEIRSLAQGIISHAAYLTGVAAFDEAEEVLTKNLVLSQSAGDQLNISYAEYFLGVIAYYRGELVEAEHRAKVARERLQTTALARHGGTFSTLQALALAALGKLDEAHRVLLETERSFTSLDRLAQAIWFGVLALIHARRGELDDAMRAADASIALADRSYVVGASGAGLFAGVTEAALLALKADHPGARARVEAALRMSRMWSRFSPVGLPQTWLYRGRRDALLGDRERARRAFERSAAMSRAKGLALVEGAARVELGGPELESAADQRAEIDRALAIRNR
jgi:tetratricopeptide (TPR) repeat protein